jgi:riboflavin kinase/FMN adenylyltransferase
VEVAATYLGHTYSVNGQVVQGKQLGRTIGYPTANILMEDKYKLIPADGVYAVKVEHNGGMYHGMLNVGNNPTIEGKGRSMEVNIFDFDQNIYGDDATIYFIERLRDEVKFNGLDELKAALAKDKVNALKILNS